MDAKANSETSLPVSLDEAVHSTDRRGEKRATFSLMRAAKLVCQAGEYVCLLRDLSAGGVRLRLFHAMPEETHVFLELADGDVHPMIKVWERNGLAGFRFASEIDPADFLARASDPESRALRIRTKVPAMVFSGGLVYAATLRDLAQGGASIESDAYLALGQSLILSIDGLGECGGWVRWRRGRDYGVMFEIKHRLDQLAEQALALQPLVVEGEGLRGVA